MVNGYKPYMVATYVRPPSVMVKGEGCYIWDIENRRYLDFTAGIAVNALGHCDPEMSKLISQQVRRKNGQNGLVLKLVRLVPSYMPPICTTMHGRENYPNWWSQKPGNPEQ